VAFLLRSWLVFCVNNDGPTWSSRGGAWHELELIGI
jgi:hypothetical protein